MKHTHDWYATLAACLNHPGYVTLAEIRQAEARECRQIAATAKWRKRGTSYHLDLDRRYYVVGREDGRRTWQIQAWSSVPGESHVVRFQGRIGTMRDARSLALAMPCCRCGLANCLPLMVQRLPARPSLVDIITERWRCADTEACEAERKRLTGEEEPARMEISQPVPLALHNPATGQSVPVTINPAGSGWAPACQNSIIRRL